MRQVEFYTFSYSTNTWRYNSGKRSVNYQNNIYLPATLSKQQISDNVIGRTQNGLTIECELNLEFLQFFSNSSPTNPLTVLIQRADLDDVAGTIAVLYSGFIVDISELESNAELLAETNATLITDYGLRTRYQPNCPKVLYDQSPGGCKAVKNNNRVTGVVDSLVSRTMVSTAAQFASDDRYSGSFIEYTHNTLGTLERVAINSSIGSSGQLSLISEPDGLEEGQQISFFTGCNRSMQDCVNVHDNRENFGGVIFNIEENIFLRQTS